MIPLDIAGVRSICQISSDKWSILLSLNEGKVCNFSQSKWDKNTSNLSPPCLFFFFKHSNLTLTSHFQKHSSCLWVGHTAQHPTDFHEPVLSEAALLSHSDSDVDGNSVCYEDTHFSPESVSNISVCSYNSILSDCSKGRFASALTYCSLY